MDDLDRSIAQRVARNPDYPRLLLKEMEKQAQQMVLTGTVYRVVYVDADLSHIATFAQRADAEAYIRRLQHNERQYAEAVETYRVEEEPLWFGVPDPPGYVYHPSREAISTPDPTIPQKPPLADADALRHQRFPSLPTDTHPRTRTSPTS